MHALQRIAVLKYAVWENDMNLWRSVVPYNIEY